MLPIRKCENCDYKATCASDLSQHMRYDRCIEKARPKESEPLKACITGNSNRIFVAGLESNTVSRRTPVARQKISKKNEWITFRIVDSGSAPLLLQEVTVPAKPHKGIKQGSVKDQMSTLKFECDS